MTGGHSYTAAGVYTLGLTVRDSGGASGQSPPFEYVVVYNPDGGSATGAGQIDSPAGAYPVNPTLTGRANFGFVSRYERGATVPSGRTQFRFHVASLNFVSTSHQWLVVSGPKAQFKGEGTINGQGQFGFLLTATDSEVSGGGSADKFRIKLWDKNDGDRVVYDNQMGTSETADPTTTIVAGNIEIRSATGGPPTSDPAVAQTFLASGANVYGNLGDGTMIDHRTPAPVLNVPSVIGLATGESHSLALASDGSVWGWGRNLTGEIGTPTTSPCENESGATCSTVPLKMTSISGVIAIAAGGHHSLALKSDGTVWGWGVNNSGVLGNSQGGPTPVQISGLSGVIAISSNVGEHALALKSDGTVWAWGYNGEGQLGDGTTINRSTPVRVNNLSGVKAIAAGTEHNLALKTDGTVWAWGDNLYGELGNGVDCRSTTGRRCPNTTPIQVQNLSQVQAIDVHAEVSLALKQDGTVWAWGRNDQCQLGIGTCDYFSYVSHNLPAQVPNLSNVTRISIGSQSGMAVSGNGQVWAWGSNSGNFGTYPPDASAVPMQVSTWGLRQVLSLEVGPVWSFVAGN